VEVSSADGTMKDPSGNADDLARRFADLAAELSQQPGIDATVKAAAEFAVSAVGCDAAGVMLLYGRGRLETVAVTDPAVAKADELQLELGEGPCVAAARLGDVFEVADTASDRQWPRWSLEVAGLGLRSVLGVVMDVGDRRVGALNLYHRQPNGFTPSDAEVADILAQHAAVAVAAERRHSQLQQAMDARTVIGEAMGILMERYGLDGDRAFAVLKRYSTTTNKKLRDVAQELIDSRKLPGLET
jgi:GAF domain-containing protein